MMQIPIIDTHQHLWDLDLLSLPWLEEAPHLAGHHRISDYMLESEDCGITEAIYMEVDVSPADRGKELSIIDEICSNPNTPTVAGVFGITPGNEDFSRTLAKLKNNPYAKGARLVLQSPNKLQGTCTTKTFVNDICHLGNCGLLFDICIRPSELNDAAKLASLCPKTTMILDHCGNADPYTVAGINDNPEDATYRHTRQNWLDDIHELSEFPNVVCKISGIVARAKPGWIAENLAPTVDHCIDCFGEDRILFGSDWPVCTAAATLLQWVIALREIVSKRPLKLQNKLLHENARNIYQLV